LSTTVIATGVVEAGRTAANASTSDSSIGIGGSTFHKNSQSMWTNNYVNLLSENLLGKISCCFNA